MGKLLALFVLVIAVRVLLGALHRLYVSFGP